MPIRRSPNGFVTPLHVIHATRSPSTGTGGHLAPEQPVTIDRNHRSPCPGARTLRAAREELDRAIAIHTATNWPTPEDYHAL